MCLKINLYFFNSYSLTGLVFDLRGNGEMCLRDFKNAFAVLDTRLYKLETGKNFAI